MLGRDGNISIIRVGTLAAIFGLLLIVGAVVFFFIDRASHQTPLEIDPYPGSIDRGQTRHSDISRSEFFQVTGVSPEDVLNFYQGKMDSFYDANTEPELKSCKRFPTIGDHPEYTRGDPGIVPYEFRCLFDRSGFNVTQYTTVIIQPGIDDNQGSTIVVHEQYWQS
jgi:hypothetical protein